MLKSASLLACTRADFGSYELLAVQAYGNIAGWQSARSWKEGKETYRGMVEVSSALMKARQDANPFLQAISRACSSKHRLPCLSAGVFVAHRPTSPSARAFLERVQLPQPTSYFSLAG